MTSAAGAVALADQIVTGAEIVPAVGFLDLFGAGTGGEVELFGVLIDHIILLGFFYR